MANRLQPLPGEFLFYETEDGHTRVECRFVADTLWLPQAGMADLFQTSMQNVAKHLKAIRHCWRMASISPSRRDSNQLPSLDLLPTCPPDLFSHAMCG